MLGNCNGPWSGPPFEPGRKKLVLSVSWQRLLLLPLLALKVQQTFPFSNFTISGICLPFKLASQSQPRWHLSWPPTFGTAAQSLQTSGAMCGNAHIQFLGYVYVL